MKNIQKCVKIYKDGGAKIFQKSQVNQPDQGHQPWQSNSPAVGRPPIEISLAWPMCRLYVPPPHPPPQTSQPPSI